MERRMSKNVCFLFGESSVPGDDLLLDVLIDAKTNAPLSARLLSPKSPTGGESRSSLDVGDTASISTLRDTSTTTSSNATMTDSTPTDADADSATPSATPSAAAAADDDDDFDSPEKRAYRNRQRRRTIIELVQTECDYIKDLSILIDHIMIPMSKKRNFLTNIPLVSAEQMQTIFSNITTLPAVNIELYDRFTRSCNRTDLVHELVGYQTTTVSAAVLSPPTSPCHSPRSRGPVPAGAAAVPTINIEQLASKLSVDSSSDSSTEAFDDNAPIMLGKIFLDLADYFRIYTQYCVNQVYGRLVWSGLHWIALDCIGLHWIALDCIGLHWIALD
jgi:hypothetical protein